MLGSGGMRSTHFATVTALAVSIGLQGRVEGSAFAIGAVLACVVYCLNLDFHTSHVMYDASGVKLHAVRQAEFVKSNRMRVASCTSCVQHQAVARFTRSYTCPGAMLGCVVALLMRN